MTSEQTGPAIITQALVQVFKRLAVIPRYSSVPLAFSLYPYSSNFRTGVKVPWLTACFKCNV